MNCALCVHVAYPYSNLSQYDDIGKLRLYKNLYKIARSNNVKALIRI